MASSSPTHSTKRRQEMLTLLQKMEILKKVDNGVPYTEIANEFHIGRSTVYDIRKNRSKIENYVHKAESGIEKRRTMRPSKYPQLEKTLYLWFLQQHRRHKTITTDMLRQKALQFSEKIYYANHFKASENWLNNFKTRFGIRLQTATGDKLLFKEPAVSSFIEDFQNKIEELNLTADQVYNADESGLLWRLLPSKSHGSRDETSTSGRKATKERITVMPCANASGTHKLKLLVIGKRKNPRPLHKINLPVVYKSHIKAYLTKELFYEWFHHDFVPDVKRFLKSRNLPQKALLVLDNALGHGPDKELVSNDGFIRTIFLPPTSTTLIQPMEQNIIQMTKINYKKKILLQAISRESNISETFKKLNIKDAVVTVSDAWDEVEERAIQSSWQNLWPTITEDEEICEEEDPIPIQELIKSTTISDTGITREDIEGWFEENYELKEQYLTDDELVNEPVTSENSSVASESDEEVVMSEDCSVKSEDALANVDICIQWAEENGMPCEMVSNLRKVRYQIIKKIYFAKHKPND